MNRRRILVVGSGQRVREAALPALARAGEWELAGLFSRRAKTIESEGREHAVSALESLSSERLAGVDLVYLVVAKPAVPTVLLRLGLLDLANVDLLIETPVMLFRHFGHLGRLAPFRTAWVSEDCTALPCFDPLREWAAGRPIAEAVFDRSAYAYHGLAMAKAVLGGGPIRSAARKKLPGNLRERRVRLGNGSRARIIEPRDYGAGRMRFTAGGETIGDVEGDPRLEAILEGKRCVGFRAGDAEARLDPDEASLLGEPGSGEGVTAWMDGMKRVGFLRLLRSIADGRGAYPLAEALEDAAVDYHLERLGRYRSTPLTNPSAPLARLSFKLLTRLAGR